VINLERFRYRKITPKIIREMKKLSKNHTQTQIAEKFNVSQAAVSYWLNEEYRKKAIIRAKKFFNEMTDEERKDYHHQVNLRRRVHQTTYFMERYHKDPEFRRKVIDINIRCHKEKSK